ncbi:sugar phosphate isomerase/epimerase [bacterium]|nr:sugar phosphate isomerase/epimerase [bacterium]MDA7924864.1 sugar phosphate isomerase/epimerase [Mariniblastus sp.]MDA7925704.1 sugar phosphate isomerase/epimerase [Mariniblastus sp.]MDB4368037.1 sugar phosphate isomerase/epimerase [Mariniblastus sp.]MDB4385839.1 sugar phosphate isomerase/epimerase [bacterium]
MDRRRILKLGVASGLAWVASPRTQVLGDLSNPPRVVAPDWLTLAVQQYSFNRQLRSGEMNILDFPKTVVEGTGIKALEYFNGHIEDKMKDTAFFKQLRKRSDDLGAVNTMMLCRSKNAVDSPDAKIRKLAIEGYRPWLEATRVLGGKYIRVDTRHKGEAEKQKGFAVAGLRSLCKVADEYEMGILVENHGNHSGNGAWLADVMKKVDLANCGTLPDFQNFKEYDPYQGVAEMMPWAKILCAKSKSFDDNGDEENVDYRKMLKIAKAAGFRGYIGIEFEGHGIDPVVGINSTKQLIQKVMRELK